MQLSSERTVSAAVRPYWPVAAMLLLLLALTATLTRRSEPATPATVAALASYPWVYLRDGQPVATDEVLVDLIAVGDIMPGRGVAAVGADWVGANGWLAAADLTLGNLEAILLDETPELAVRPGQILLRGPAGAATDLRVAGFDLLSVANNHALDYGPAGLAQSVAHLERAGLEVVGLATATGATQAVIRQVNGLRLAFLASSAVPGATAGDGVSPRPMFWDPVKVTDAIRTARQEADAVIVAVHWGYEYEPLPDPQQVAMVQLMADAGADLIIGHHPHVAQPLATVGDSFVAYSLGNFLFDQSTGNTSEALTLRALFDEDGLRAVQLLPLQAGVQPQLLPLTEAAALLARTMPAPPRVGFACAEATCMPIQLPSTAEAGPFYGGSIDLTGDGEPEIIRRVSGQVLIYEQGQEVWRSPSTWQIDDVALGDPNNDGRYEILLALHRPDAAGILRSQPYIIGYRGGRYDLLWGGRPVNDPIRELVVGDVDDDGLQELAVIEELADGRGLVLSIWRWSGWAFTLRWRSEPGNYHGLRFHAGEQPALSVSGG